MKNLDDTTKYEATLTVCLSGEQPGVQRQYCQQLQRWPLGPRSKKPILRFGRCGAIQTRRPAQTFSLFFPRRQNYKKNSSRYGKRRAELRQAPQESASSAFPPLCSSRSNSRTLSAGSERARAVLTERRRDLSIPVCGPRGGEPPLVQVLHRRSVPVRLLDDLGVK